jgi:hypothetical protein
MSKKFKPDLRIKGLRTTPLKKMKSIKEETNEKPKKEKRKEKFEDLLKMSNRKLKIIFKDNKELLNYVLEEKKRRNINKRRFNKLFRKK